MTAPEIEDTADRQSPPSVAAVGLAVLASPRRRLLFVGAAAIVTVAYTILLPFDFTQRLSIANWHYLTPALLAWSAAMGLGMAFVLAVQVHAVRLLAVRRSAVTMGGLAFVGGLLPSLLCCSPLIPTLLAFVGLSTAQVYGTTGAFQHFFAVHQTFFLAGSVLLLLVAAWWGMRRVARSTCAADQDCPVLSRTGRPAAPALNNPDSDA